MLNHVDDDDDYEKPSKSSKICIDKEEFRAMI